MPYLAWCTLINLKSLGPHPPVLYTPSCQYASADQKSRSRRGGFITKQPYNLQVIAACICSDSFPMLQRRADIPTPIPPPLKDEHRLSGEGPLLGRFPDRGNTLPQLKSGESDSSGTLFHSPSAQQSAASRLAGAVPGESLALSVCQICMYHQRISE